MTRWLVRDDISGGLMTLLRDRHNAMLADQAAEAINDFRVALYLLCCVPGVNPFDIGSALYREPFAAQWFVLDRGLR